MTTTLVILALYMACMVGVGFWAQRKAKSASSKDFLTGGESTGSIVGGVAMFAAFATGGTMLGNMGVSYGLGWGYMAAMNAGVVLGYLLTSFFVAKPFRNMKIATVPEFFKVRYDSAFMRIAVPIILICSITAYLVAQMKVAGLIGENILGIPYMWSIIITGAVFVFYTTVGGMFAVTITDFLQGALMFFIAFIACMLVFGEYGGPSTVLETAKEIRPEWVGAAKQPLTSYIGAFAIWATCLCVLPHTIMRVFAAKDEKTGRISLGILTLLYTLTCVFTTIFIAGGAVILNKGELPMGGNDGAFLSIINALFSPGLAGLTFAAIFAAVMSSVSAMLLSVGAALSYDLVKVLKPDFPDNFYKRLNMGFMLVIGVLVCILAMDPPELLTLLYTAAMGFLASALFWPVMLGLYWKRMNKYGAIASVLGGGGVYLFCLFGMKLAPLSQICYSIPVSLVLSIVVSLATAPSSEKEMRRISIAHEREYNEALDSVDA